MARRRQRAVLPLRRQLFAVDVTTDGSAFASGVPKRLFDIPAVSATHGEYVVTHDGQRFLVAAASDKAVAQPIEVVVNWR